LRSLKEEFEGPKYRGEEKGRRRPYKPRGALIPPNRVHRSKLDDEYDRSHNKQIIEAALSLEDGNYDEYDEEDVITERD
jgi:hypothetical protein